MLKVIQLMVRSGESTANVGEMIARHLSGFLFTNVYLQGKKPARTSGVFLNAADFITSGFFRFLLIGRAWARCRPHRPDVIIAHRFKCAHIAYYLSKLFACRLVVVVHGEGEFDRPYRKAILERALESGALVVCVSSYIRSYICSVVGEHPGVSVIRNSIDFDTIRKGLLERDAARRRLGIDGRAGLTLGFIGRLVPVKGISDIIDVASRFKGGVTQFYIVGSGRSGEELMAQAQNLGVGDRVNFVGHVPEAVKIVRAFDALLIPSRSEGFPLTLLEAAAAGVPVITTDIPVFSEIMEGRGLAYRTGDVASFQQAIEKIAGLYASGELASYGADFSRFIETNNSFANFLSAYRDALLGKNK